MTSDDLDLDPLDVPLPPPCCRSEESKLARARVGGALTELRDARSFLIGIKWPTGWNSARQYVEEATDTIDRARDALDVAWRIINENDPGNVVTSDTPMTPDTPNTCHPGR